MSIETRSLTHTYMAGSPFARTALKDINLMIDDGEIVGIIGHTGSGKSTLIQHFNGLLKATTGTVILDGVDLGGKGVKLRAIRQKVGLVFQYPEHQLFEETVWDDVAFGPRNMGLEGEELKRRVREALLAVGLDPETIGPRSPFELSGGQKRRVALAGVLAMEPAVLVLDEPTAGLDPRGREDLLQQIERLHAERQLTVVYVSHNMAEVARIAQRLIVMHEGKIVMEGPPREIFRRASQLRKLGLGVPEITEIMYKLAEHGLDVSTNVLTVEEAETEILAALAAKARVSSGADA